MSFKWISSELGVMNVSIDNMNEDGMKMALHHISDRLDMGLSDTDLSELATSYHEFIARQRAMGWPDANSYHIKRGGEVKQVRELGFTLENDDGAQVHFVMSIFE